MNAWCVPEENPEAIQSFSPGNEDDPGSTIFDITTLRAQKELEEISRQELLDLDNEQSDGRKTLGRRLFFGEKAKQYHFFS
jgi:hypothetical protein